MPSASKNGRVFWSAAVAVIVTDFITKRLAEAYLAPRHVPHDMIGDVVRFTLAYNPGAAFSMWLGPYSRFIFGAFALIALYVVWRLQRHTAAGHVARALSLGLIWGGAAGNLIDRFRGTQGVVDFIDVGWADHWRFWTFNVADSAVTVGAILLGIVLWREDRAAARTQAARSGASEAQG